MVYFGFADKCGLGKHWFILLVSLPPRIFVVLKVSSRAQKQHKQYKPKTPASYIYLHTTMCLSFDCCKSYFLFSRNAKSSRVSCYKQTVDNPAFMNGFNAESEENEETCMHN